MTHFLRRALGIGQPVYLNPRAARVTVGAIGHPDHGMTTLTAAVVARQAHKNGAGRFATYKEIARGGVERDERKTVSVAPAHVDYTTPARAYHHIDCPGFPGRIRENIAALASMDGAVLVVAADEGAMPGTREHVLLARQCGVPSLVVFLTRVDRVDDPALLDLVELELRALLSGAGFRADSPVIRGNALAAMLSEGKDDRACRCIDDLVSALDATIVPRHYDPNGPFLMPVQDVFSAEGRGTVGTGRIERGTVKAGDEVEVVGLGRASRTAVVAGVEPTGGAAPGTGVAGDVVGVVFRGVERSGLGRGMALAAPGSVAPHTRFEADLYVLTEGEGGRRAPLLPGQRAQFYFGTADVTGTVTLPEGVAMCLPGEHTRATVELPPDESLVMEEGQRFACRADGQGVAVGAVTKFLG